MNSKSKTEEFSSPDQNSFQLTSEMLEKLKNTLAVTANQEKPKATNIPQGPRVLPAQQQKIDEFLKKLHRKISESMNSSESQILSIINIDWDEDSQSNTPPTCVPNSLPNSKQKHPQTLFQLLDHSVSDFNMDNMEIEIGLSLGKLCSIGQLVQILDKNNQPLCGELKKIVEEHKNLELECHCLRWTNSKLEEKVSLLEAEILTLQAVKLDLNDDILKLKEDLAIQIGVQEENIKNAYEKMVEALNEEKITKIEGLKISQSTNMSGSGTIKHVKSKSHLINHELNIPIFEKDSEKIEPLSQAFSQRLFFPSSMKESGQLRTKQISRCSETKTFTQSPPATDYHFQYFSGSTKFEDTQRSNLTTKSKEKEKSKANEQLHRKQRNQEKYKETKEIAKQIQKYKENWNMNMNWNWNESEKDKERQKPKYSSPSSNSNKFSKFNKYNSKYQYIPQLRYNSESTMNTMKNIQILYNQGKADLNQNNREMRGIRNIV